MSNAKNSELEVSFDVNGNTVRLTPRIVQEYIMGNNTQITMPEFKMFTELCKVRKLNPFLKEAYCIKYGSEPAQLIVGKDVIVGRAVTHPQYDGKETGVIVQCEDGKTVERQGCFKLPSETLVGGWAKVYRKDRSRPEYMSVSFDEVANRKRDGELNTNWKNKGATMVEKVAKVRALRECFVDELSGLYEAEEFGEELPSVEKTVQTEAPIDVQYDVIHEPPEIRLSDL